MPDHLQTWLAVRETVPWQRTRATAGDRPFTPARDGAVHDIRSFDHARDPERADALLEALDRVRADAAAGAPLTCDLLTGWQRTLLRSRDAPFRTRPAYAKAGRERYGIAPDTRSRFEDCLAQGDDTRLPPAARAARAYLDVCFFHPFDDGNARSAFLTLTFVLARAGIVLDQVGPIRRLSRRADDPAGALALADLVAVLADTSRRRGTPAPLPRVP
ncbi:Fic family protein [Kitasatospora sp. MBT63]|uniref:Fic family protein n=1 Tax=Kitasatospora sp. MBT63 TaxID=1444768 RepID=UPI0009EA2037|nr:Fic family protein [Kitasatospora sp. MBT63]